MPIYFTQPDASLILATLIENVLTSIYFDGTTIPITDYEMCYMYTNLVVVFSYRYFLSLINAIISIRY